MIIRVREVDFPQHIRISDKTQSMGGISQWVLHIFMQPVVCLAATLSRTQPLWSPPTVI